MPQRGKTGGSVVASAAAEVLCNPAASSAAGSVAVSEGQAVSLAYVQEHLEALLIRVSQGEDIAIDVPPVGVVRLTMSGDQPLSFPPRVLGQWRHLASIPDHRLLAPLDDDDLSWMSGELSESP